VLLVVEHLHLEPVVERVVGDLAVQEAGDGLHGDVEKRWGHVAEPPHRP
jgi:hypothetical protein